MFCIMADSDVSIHSAFGIELLPPFFDTFYADEVRQLFWFRLTHLFPLAVQLLESGYTSFTFSIERFRYNHAQFKFEGPNGLLRKVNFLLTHVVRPLSIRKIDLSAFVTMDSREFSSIISKYHMFGCVSRWISFSYAIIQETIIILQDGQCITGCIRAPNEVQFIIAVKGGLFQEIHITVDAQGNSAKQVDTAAVSSEVFHVTNAAETAVVGAETRGAMCIIEWSTCC
uniref:Uncharacterized protein n=1 Tax=Cucumis melo TaxID=3656 RepID=A0A9I9EKU6_CUCME